MILVLTNNYPSEDNLYANGFVHTRVLGYLKKGIEVEVFVCKKIWDKQLIHIKALVLLPAVQMT